eukprot:929278-Amphidinium_carterae.1
MERTWRIQETLYPTFDKRTLAQATTQRCLRRQQAAEQHCCCQQSRRFGSVLFDKDEVTEDLDAVSDMDSVTCTKTFNLNKQKQSCKRRIHKGSQTMSTLMCKLQLSQHRQ